MLTIAQLAAHAGVTVRTVRHYHAKGLLPEPERDASGYRRYDAKAVVDLIKIRTLADAGVPLARVEELLQADDEQLAEAVAEIDKRLRAEIRRLRHHRERVARLTAGDSLALPKVVVDYLEKLRRAGITERAVEIERDGWILIAAHSPEKVEGWIKGKSDSLDSPEYLGLYHAFGEAIVMSPDDPRLEEVADRLSEYVQRMTDMHAFDDVEDASDVFDEGFVAVLDSVAFESAPSLQRLGELLQERGWTGWNQIEPADDSTAR